MAQLEKITELINTLEILQDSYQRGFEHHHKLAESINEDYNFAKSSSYFNFVGELQWIILELKKIKYTENIHKK